MAQDQARPRLADGAAKWPSMLRVSDMTVYRLIKAGELRALQIGKSYRLREEDVDAFLASRFTEAG